MYLVLHPGICEAAHFHFSEHMECHAGEADDDPDLVERRKVGAVDPRVQQHGDNFLQIFKD